MANRRPRPELQAQRRAAGLSQEALAHKIGVSANSVRGWESGLQSPRLRFREPLARQLGVSLGQLSRLLDPDAPISLNGDALQGSDSLFGWLSIFVKAEQASARAWVFEAANMPALAQTAPYALALERTYHRPSTDAEAEQRAELRLARAGVLNRQPDPLELSLIIPWYILHQVAGDATVMAGQLDHLTALAERPNVDLRILPRGQTKVSVPGTFTVLQTAGASGPDLAAEDGLRGFRYHDEPSAVADFVNLFERIIGAALPAMASTALIAETRKDYR
jgi:transcriptional regulator with XRE-family HTH domain